MNTDFCLHLQFIIDSLQLNTFIKFFIKMAQIKVTQTSSLIDRPRRQHLIMESLGIRGIGKSKVHETSPSIMGMVRKVMHLVKVENL